MANPSIHEAVARPPRSGAYSPEEPDASATRVADHKAMIQRLFDGVGRGELSVIAEVISDRNILHRADGAVLSSPSTRIARYAETARSVLPDLQIAVEHIVAEGDLVSTVERWSGTTSATGERAESLVYHQFRFEGGQVVEEWCSGFVSPFPRIVLEPEAART